METPELIEWLKAFAQSPAKAELDDYRRRRQIVLDNEARQAARSVEDVLRLEGIKGSARQLDEDLIVGLLQEKEAEWKKLTKEREKA